MPVRYTRSLVELVRGSLVLICSSFSSRRGSFASWWRPSARRRSWGRRRLDVTHFVGGRSGIGIIEGLTLLAPIKKTIGRLYSTLKCFGSPIFRWSVLDGTSVPFPELCPLMVVSQKASRSQKRSTDTNTATETEMDSYDSKRTARV